MDSAAAMTSGIGTAAWMAPELIDGGQYTEKVDVYSFAMVAFEIVTNQVPFSGMNTVQISHVVVNQDTRPKLPATCPANMRELIERCWVKSPAQRPSFASILKFLQEGVKTDDFFGKEAASSAKLASISLEDVQIQQDSASQDAVKELNALGFAEGNAMAALLASGGQLETAREYLVRSASNSSSSGAQLQAYMNCAPSAANLEQLLEVGFDRGQATAALLATGDDPEAARTYLVSRATSTKGAPAEPDPKASKTGVAVDRKLSMKLIDMGFDNAVVMATLKRRKNDFDLALAELCGQIQPGDGVDGDDDGDGVDRLSGLEWNMYARKRIGCKQQSPANCWACNGGIHFEDQGLWTACSCGTISMCNGQPCETLGDTLTVTGFFGKV
eukprot:TRINITY_DN8228_c0_g1_i2.p1 TRINITY_DN8228_c0_g1~~TRINITY_DN8228_c0_g1_i2.p1  ORF type:complete len:387 (+),score=116.94 TRINITY_DN8228_c0_g1_i2:753-1913(+)